MRFFLPLLLLLFPLALTAAQVPPPGVPAPAEPQVAPATLVEHALGDPKAPVTLIEYASLSCPHCAHFATEMLPKIEEKYITPGKLRLVYRDFPLEAMSLKAAQLAHCMPEERYFPFIKTIFGNQKAWLESREPEATLAQYAKLAGLSEGQIKTCLADKSLEAALVKQRQEAEEKFKINATPTFVVNGIEKIEGAKDIADFDKALAKYIK